jgi:hypothetical protein
VLVRTVLVRAALRRTGSRTDLRRSCAGAGRAARGAGLAAFAPARAAPLRVAGGRYGSGAGSRSRRPNLPGPCVRSAATASGSCRAAFASTPMMSMVITSEVPP